jgi:hypothetical protein
MLFSGGKDGMVKLWEASGLVVCGYQLAGEVVEALWDPSGGGLLVGTSVGAVHLLKIEAAL